jgi:RHS repeat-associated protein
LRLKSFVAHILLNAFGLQTVLAQVPLPSAVPPSRNVVSERSGLTTHDFAGLALPAVPAGPAPSLGPVPLHLAPMPVSAASGAPASVSPAVSTTGGLGTFTGAVSPIDLRTWSQQGNAADGAWLVDADGQGVVQNLAGNPSFFVSPDDQINTTIRGSITVPAGTGFFGLVLGYRSPIALNGDDPGLLNLVLLDWKGATETSGGFTAQEGLSLSQVQGTFSSYLASFWGHQASAGFQVLGSAFGTGKGWHPGHTYQIEIAYRRSRVRVAVDGAAVLDQVGSFPEGRIGFYSYAQSDVRFQGFTAQPNNAAPIANAGPNQTIPAGATCRATVTLDGSGSSDADGDTLTYTWSGPFGSVQGVKPTVTVPQGINTVSLTVDDGNGATASARVEVLVPDLQVPLILCPAPVLVKTAPGVCQATGVTLGTATATDNCAVTSLTNDAPATFPHGTTLVTWAATDPSRNLATCSQPVMVDDSTPPAVQASIQKSQLWPPNHKMVDVGFTAQATDTCGDQPSLIVQVFSNEPADDPDSHDTPDALLDPAGKLTLRSERLGDGSGRVYLVIVTATDPAGNAGHGCPTVVVPHDQSGGSVASINAQAKAAQTYCQANGAAPVNFVMLTSGPFVTPNQPPHVSAGPNQTITLPTTSVTLNGTATDDGLPVGSTLSVLWSVVSGPGVVTFANSTTALTGATFAGPGAYVLRLTASDTQLTSSSDVTITVVQPNQPPKVSAGPDQTITLPANTVTLSGTATDDGLPSGILNISWSKVSGPGGVTFGSPTVPITTATFSAAGVYVLRLTASDTQLSSSADVKITVTPPNQPPVVNAGPNQTITLPTNTVTLSGTATDDGLPVGSTLTAVWTKVSGPGNVAFGNPASPATTATFGAAGAYDLRLTASDTQLTSSSDIMITVNPAPANQPPKVNAGPSQTIALPTTTVTLSGSATDDGLPNPPGVTTLAWSVVSGPGPVTFGSPASATTTATFTLAGTYVLRLTASDSQLSASSDVAVVVKPQSQNQPPTVSAGPNQTINLPTTTVTLNGTATDDGLPVGSTLSVSWSKVSGPGTVVFASPSSARTTATLSVPGVYDLRLSASDTQFTSTSDVTITLTPANQPPVVNAGPNQSITLPTNTVALNGTATDDGLPIGSTLAVSWSELSGPAPVVFGNPRAAATTATFSAAGVYDLRLSASDSVFTSTSDTTVTVNPSGSTGQPPTVSAGPAQTITLPTNSVTLAGSATEPGLPPGATLTVAWSRVSGPGTVVFADINAASTTATFSGAGIFVLRLTASDGQLTSTSDVTITVNLAGGNLPDLVVLRVDASGAAVNGQTLQITGVVAAQVANQGPASVTSAFVTTFFEDRNGNGLFDPGIDNVLGTATLPGLDAGSSALVTASVSGTVLFPGNLVYALVDSGQAIVESNKVNNYGNSAPPCVFTPPKAPFDATLKWAWTGSSVLPDSNNVMMTPAVMDLNGDGIPEVIFTSFTGGSYYGGGRLRAVSGKDGSEIFTVTDPNYQVFPASHLAVGDIDGDGHPEIIAVHNNGQQIIAFAHDGTPKWVSPFLEYVAYGGPALANLDGDGHPPVIVIGRQVLNNDGTIRWTGTGGRGANVFGGPQAIVADIDLDGRPEIVAGNTVYRADGTILWQNTSLPDGFNAVANFGSDPYPQIVLVSNSKVWLLDHTGAVKWGPVSLEPQNGIGGPPLVADLDGDGIPEIGIAGYAHYVVIGADGKIKWTAKTQDVSSHQTSSTAFDFFGDGKMSVVYRDETTLWVFRGTDGAVLLQIPVNSGTQQEGPVVADVDGGGSAEIVTVADPLFGGPKHGVYVFGDPNGAWVSTRKVWNQHSYHVTNINDDGSIPTHETNNWQTYNSYRQQAPTTACRYALPDLTASFLRIAEGSPSRTLTARIGNGGDRGVASGVSVSFYDGDPSLGRVLLGTVTTVTTLNPGGYEDVSLVLPSSLSTTHSVWVVADDLGNGKGIVTESNKANNVYDSGLALVAVLGLPDLVVVDVSTVSLTGNWETLAISGRVSADIRNQGEAAVTTSFSIAFFEDRNGNGVYDPGIDNLLATATQAGLGAGQTVNVSASVSGSLLFRDSPVYAFVDSAGQVTESDKTNNVGRSGATCSFHPPVESFSPRLKWSWTGSSVLPAYNSVAGTPAVADVNGDGIPDVIFITLANANTTGDGHLRAVSGRDGRELFTVTNTAWNLRPASGIAVGSLDGDGKIDIVAVHESGKQLIAFGPDGSFKWLSPVLDDPFGVLGYSTGSPALVDLDGDGLPEIVFGRQVFNHDGTLRWTGTGGTGSLYSVAADLDLDGTPEVIAGNTAYRADGTILWQATGVPDGFVAVARLDADPHPSVVVSYFGELWLLDHAGALKWGPIFLPCPTYGSGPPVIADFDGSGTLQIGVACAATLSGVDAAGSVKWSIPISSYPGPTGASAFDLDGDGTAELIEADLNGLRIVRGGDGKVLATVPLQRESIAADYPLVADVDGDGKAEIVAIANGRFAGTSHGIFVYGDANDNWVGARRIWNQHSYHVTNVSDDGRIPAHETPTLAGFHEQTGAPRQSALAAPDFTASFVREGASGANVTLTARIGNGGAELGSTGLPVSFYNGDPRAGGSLLGTVLTSIDLAPGQYQDVTLTLTGSPAANGSVFVSANDRGGLVALVNECNKANNLIDSGLFLNQPPVVNAGPSQTITLPTSSVALAGSVSDDGLPVGSTVTSSWSVVSGPGSVTFGNPSAPSTSATFVAPGVYVLRLTASDTQLTSTSDVTVTVLAAPQTNQPPVVSAGPAQSVVLPNAALLVGTATDDGLPVGSHLTVSWSVVNGPGPVVFGNPISAVTTATVSVPGVYVLRLTASDSQLASSSDVVVTVSTANQPPVVNAGPSQTITLPASTVTLSGSVTDDGLPVGGALTQVWSELSGPGPVTFGSPNSPVTTVMFVQQGVYALRLTASDSQLTSSADVTIVVDAAPPTGPPPTAAITSPEEGAIIRAPVEIIGTAASASLAAWVLEYRLTRNATFTRFASGNAAVTNGVLAVFDPTILLNGLYEVRLTATDTANRSAAVSLGLVVRDNQKVGNFTVSFVDLEVPVAGLPIRATRTYDSRDKGQGDFGIGWRLDLSNTTIDRNGSGTDWQGVTTGGGFPSYCLQETRAHLVTLTFPNGAVYEFQQLLTPQCQSFAPIAAATVTYQPVTPTLGSLSAVDGTDVIVSGSWPGPLQVFRASDFTLYDPSLFQLTLPDGHTFIIDRVNGLQKITDTNGNTLSFGPGGITHSSGKGVSFQRDASGRITSIIDPNGASMSYVYSAGGDLTSYHDRQGNVSTYTYDPNFPHLLSTILDPLGHQPIKNTYYPDGRIQSHTDAFGKTITYAHDLAGRQEIITDRLGNQRVLAYDERGNVTSETDQNAKTTTRTFDSRNNRLSETNPLGQTTTYTYDAFNNPTSVADPLGNATTYTYSSLQKVLTSTDPRGKVTTNVYDASGNLTSTTDAMTNVTSYTYDSQGNVLTQTDPLMNVTKYEYNVPGNLTKQTDALGHVTTYAYDANGNRLSQIATQTVNGVPQTLTTTYTYDAVGRLLQTTDADGSVTKTTYDGNGHQATTVDKLGRTTSYSYDLMGRLTTTSYPDGTSESSLYDAEGRRTSRTDRAGHTTTYAYDNLGRLLTTSYPDGATVTNTYDDSGRLVSVKDPLGNTTSYGYDTAGRRVSVTDALGKVTTFGYDQNGNQVSVKDAIGNTTTYVYDSLSRRTQSAYPDRTFAQTGYDGLGRRISETDQAGKRTQFGYDALGRLARVTDALSQVTSYAYDELGNRVSQTDANGHTTAFTYDTLGRETSRILPDGKGETKSYDLAGNLQNRTDFLGRTTIYGYDLNNRLASRNYPDGSTVSFTYTATGRRTTAVDPRGVTTYTYDTRDRLQTLASPDGRSLTYAYDAQGNRRGLTATVGTTTLTTAYAFDLDNRLQTVTDPQRRAYTLGYDPNGNRASLAYPNGVMTTYTYNTVNRLTNLTSQGPLQLVQSYAYTLGPTGNRTQVSEADGTLRQYTYDFLYRLTGETVSGNLGVVYAKSFSYDPVGNRQTQVTTGQGAASQTYTYDTRDRLLSDTLANYGYDDNGNLVTKSGEATYTWDFENRLTRVQKVDGTLIQHVYDADGNRVQTTSTLPGQPPQVVNYLVDTSGPLSQVVAESNGVGQLTAYYVRGDDLLSVIRGTGTRFYHADGLGSIRRLTDEAGNITDGYTYSAFGELLAHTGTDPQPYAFAGEPLDPNSGFQYHRARWMDPRVGRFISADSLPGSASDPTSLHNYLYANADPVDTVDPTGHEGEGGLAGSFTGFAGGDTIAAIAIPRFLSLSSLLGGRVKIVGFRWTNSTFHFYFGKQKVSDDEIRIIKDSTYTTMREAFSEYAVELAEGGGTNAIVITDDQPSGEAGATHGVGLATASQVNYQFLAAAGLSYWRPLRAPRYLLAAMIGHGIGATAAHEFGHQLGTLNGTTPHTWDLEVADLPEHFDVYASLRWSDAARKVLAKTLEPR